MQHNNGDRKVRHVLWRKLRRIGLKKGAGETVSFMMVTILALIQAAGIKQRLEYTAYTACRAAVTCKNYDDAVKTAERVAKEDLHRAQSIGKIKYVSGSEKVDLLFADEEVRASTGRPSASSADTEKWKKGQYVRCTVTVKLKTLIAFMDGERTVSIVMMIENPATEGGEYPWFSKM